MSGIFGAVYEKGSTPSLRDLYSQSQQTNRIDQRQAVREAEAKKKEETKSQYFLNKFWDPTRVATGTPMDEMITSYMINKRPEYAKMMKEGGFSYAEMLSMMQQDMLPVSEYLQNAKVFNQNIKKYQQELTKQGFKASEVDKLLREKMFFDKDEKGNLTPKDFKDVEWDVDGALSTVMQENLDKLTINQETAYKDLRVRPKSTVSGEFNFSNTPNAGAVTKTREKGTAKFDPLFFDIKQDDKNVVTDIVPKTRDFYSPDGSLYVDKFTGKEAAPVLADDAFDYIYNGGNVARKSLIDQRVNKRAAELKASGKNIDDTDLDYLRREEALGIVMNNAGNELRDSKSLVHGYRRPERPRVSSSSSKAPDVIDYSIAPKTNDGGASIMGQTGEFNLGRNLETNRVIKTDDIISYQDGRVKILYSDRDKFGNRIGAQKEKTLSAEEAKRMLNANRNLPGNKKVVERINVSGTPSTAKKQEAISQPPAPAKKDTPATKIKGTNKRLF